MSTTITQHPDIAVTNYNAPWVMPGGLGVYTRAFGETPGYWATQGRREDIQVVQVRDGRVVSRSTQLPGSGRVRGACSSVAAREPRPSPRWRSVAESPSSEA